MPRRKGTTRKGAKKARYALHADVAYAPFWKWVEQELEIKLVPEHRIHPIRRFRLDFAHVESRTGIEIDGGIYTGKSHGTVEGMLRDREKTNFCARCGWVLLRFPPNKIMTEETLEIIADTIEIRKSQFKNTSPYGNAFLPKNLRVSK